MENLAYKRGSFLPLQRRHSSASASSFIVFIMLTFFLIIVTTENPLVQAQRSSYSKLYSSCSSDRDCDSSRTYLKCHDRICQCSHVNHFDEEINRCLIRSGGSCTVGSKTQYCVPFAYCVSHSKSSLGGSCKCRARYHESIDGLCNFSPISSKQISLQNRLLLLLPVASVLLKNLL